MTTSQSEQHRPGVCLSVPWLMRQQQRSSSDASVDYDGKTPTRGQRTDRRYTARGSITLSVTLELWEAGIRGGSSNRLHLP